MIRKKYRTRVNTDCHPPHAVSGAELKFLSRMALMDDISVSGKPIYKRILLKLSGEALQGEQMCGIDASKLTRIVQEILSVTKLGVQVALVIGGGNLIRGADLSAADFER